jgi:holo-[acyl-carrier protein] synthase
MTTARTKQNIGDHDSNSDLLNSVRRMFERAMSMPDMPQLRVGCDVCDVAKLRYQLSTTAAQRFLAATFTPSELTYCAGRADRLAARWAAKEAVAKAVGSGFRGLRPSHIEIARHPTGAPYVRPMDGHQWPDNAHEWHWSISLAHEGDIAVAIAFAMVSYTSSRLRAIIQTAL